MRGLMVPKCFRGRLRGTSLLEATVAAAVFLLVFTAVMELIPRLSVRNDDALLVAEAEYRVEAAFRKYGTGVWPPGAYAEFYTWGAVAIRIESYREFDDMQAITVTARIDGSGKRIARKRLVACVP